MLCGFLSAKYLIYMYNHSNFRTRELARKNCYYARHLHSIHYTDEELQIQYEALDVATTRRHQLQASRIYHEAATIINSLARDLRSLLCTNVQC